MNVFKLTIFVAATIFIGSFSQLPSNLFAQQTDKTVFLKKVQPILQSRCIKCHNADRAEGNLRFDSSRDAVANGGHTGRAILGTSAADSELINRINSTKAGYRMPKKGPPLTDAQIVTLTEWVDAGAVWVAPPKMIRKISDLKTPDLKEGDSISTVADRLVWFQKQMEQPGFRGLVYLFIVFCVTMLVVLWWMRRSFSSSSWLSRLKTLLILILGFFCVATYIHYDAKQKDTARKLDVTEAKLLTYTGPPEFQHSLTAPYPMHPPRLGGVYYRGNDERDAQLFNGGFYRTAQFEIWLTDEEGSRFKWGDSPSGELFINFEIQRAANTTGELFNDDIMSVIGLANRFELNDDPDVRPNVEGFMKMQTVESGQKWRCRFSIGDLTNQQSLSGKLFVVQNTSRPKAHYAIEFEIATDDAGKLLERSQLWMGSLYNLNGRVFVPYDDQKILLDRWFDWRPIPEVVGKQSDDPDLLGIPEHQ